jgi:hypothetical protein
VPLGTFFDLRHLVGHEPVCLTMEVCGCLGTGCVDQAEDLFFFLVEPVSQCLGIVFVLNLETFRWASATASAVNPVTCLWWSMYSGMVLDLLLIKGRL